MARDEGGGAVDGIEGGPVDGGAPVDGVRARARSARSPIPRRTPAV